MSVQNVRDKMNTIKQIDQLLPFVQNADVYLSYTGRFKIIVNGYSGNLGLDALNLKMRSLGVRMTQEYANSNVGKINQARDEIQRIYKKVDQMHKNYWLIKRIIISFIDIISNMYDSENDIFFRYKWSHYYDEEEFYKFYLNKSFKDSDWLQSIFLYFFAFDRSEMEEEFRII